MGWLLACGCEMCLYDCVCVCLDEFMKNNAPISEIVEHCQETLAENSTLTDVHIAILLWKSVMNAIEWNKKEDLLAEQALRHLQVSCSEVMW